jgi:hypothetical protein
MRGRPRIAAVKKLKTGKILSICDLFTAKNGRYPVVAGYFSKRIGVR